jgi:uncharacterized protein (TIGR02646 family)
MRPVDRGPLPTDGNGNSKVYAEHADARADLFGAMGRYCSFCERPIKAGLAVEHVQCQKHFPQLEREWTNFLLACVNCNSTKGAKKISRKGIFLPDQDNTFLALTYSTGGKVRTTTSLTSPQKSKATKLIQLVWTRSH